MGWIKNKVFEVLAGTQPISKKLAWLLVLLVVIGVFAVSTVTGASGQQTRRIENSESDTSTPGGIADPVISEPIIFVHIVGEVAKPGIYELDAGARVFDAVFAAGGFTDDAEQATVNLARLLTDGEQIFIGQIGAEPLTVPAQVAGEVLVNINRASPTELEALPGVGPALATRIIDYRTANGGFKAIEELMNVGGIGDKLFAGIKPRVTL